MDFRILGPLEALDEGRAVALGGSKQRALLALLLLHANETLSTDRLIDELWGEHPPATAAKTVQVHVSRLRKALAAGAGNGSDGVVVTRERGYELRVDPECLDAHRFERLLAEGRSELAAGRPEQAASTLETALLLWRGPPLHDLAFEPFAQREIARFDDLHIAAVEQLVEAKLALGRHVEVVAQLETLIAEHPYREGLRAQLMLALYRSGRQAEALQAYQEARRTLVEELGIEPGERLRELERAVLGQDPALATPESPPDSLPLRPRAELPSPPTRTVGREEDLAAVAGLLNEAEVRLVTLTGPGGVGKTRLALEVAFALEPQLPDGAWFVSLASTSSPEHVPSAVAHALGVTPLQGETPKEALERFLAAKRGLLVLDNFEHLLPAAPLVGGLLTACAELVVVATSREPLHLQAEQRYAVEPLKVPADGEPAAIERAAAGRLFVERARSHDRHFELTDGNAGAIGEICRRLDGLPLAIELAAARTTLLGAEELSARLGQALDVLGSGPLDAPDRQRTLRATVEWSHRLLRAPEAEAFGRFAVFAGGATIEAAQWVTGADLDALEGLIDKQLLRRHGSGRDTRLLMLETVREYAQERLDADESTVDVHGRHCRHYLALAERAEPQLNTRGEADWLARLDAEIDNLRAALDWSTRRDPAVALRLASLLVWFWDIRNRFDEGLEWLGAALEAAGDAAPIGERARARRAQVHLLAGKGSVYDWQGSMKDARARANEALALSRQAGDPAGVGQALLGLAQLEVAEPLPQRRRRELAEEALALARESGDDRLVAFALRARALALSAAEGSAEFDAAVAALRRVGSSRELAGLYSDAAYNAIKEGRPERASPLLDQALALARELGDPVTLAFVCGNLGLEALFSGDLDRARAAFNDQLRICREHVLWVAAEGLSGLAAVAAQRDDPKHAALLLGAATGIGPWDADADVGDALEQQFFEPARQHYGERRWSKQHAAGTRLSLEEAIDLALGARADRC
jgi:predicted ATPase/DNA-binding SARP family transcriptional activator